MRRRGFTFVEVTAAVAIGAFVTVVAVGALKSVSDGARTVRLHSEMAAEMRFVTNLLRADLENLYKDAKIKHTKLTGGLPLSGDSEQITLAFYTILHQQARVGMPESDIYEVEYGIMEREDKHVFVRRVWPNPDKERDPGGVMTILAEHIVDFRVRFYDGEQWTEEWSEEETRTLPDLIEVQIVGQWEKNHRPVIRNFMINLVQGDGEMEGLEGEGDGGSNNESSNEIEG